MNLGQIREDVRSLIIEPNPGFRSNEEINRWINQAHQEMGMMYRLEELKAVRVNAGQTFVELPEEVLVFRGAWDEEGNSIPIIPSGSGQDLSKRTNTSSLSIYHYGQLLVLVPAPSIQTYIRVFYDRKPKQLYADSDVPEIPEPYHRYLVSYATMKALMKDEAYDAANEYQEEYQYGLQMIATHKLPMPENTNRVLQLYESGILNAAEAAEWLNLPMKEKIWNRVEVETKALRLFNADVVTRAELLENTVFPDKEDIQKNLEITAGDFATPPSMWKDDINGE